MKKILDFGEYIIPVGAIVERNGQSMIIRQTQRKAPRDNVCRNCKYWREGYATASKWSHSTVCVLMPKKYRDYQRIKWNLDGDVFYYRSPTHIACEKFERRI